MKKRRSFFSLLMSFLSLAAVCMLGFFATTFVLGLPSNAELVYGPASPSLSPFQLYPLSFKLLDNSDALLQPLDPSGAEQDFTIALGESTVSVLGRLAEAGLIRDQEALRNYLIYTGLDTEIQAGAYRLSPGMTAVEIAQALLDATPTHVTFVVLAGWRIEEIAASLPTSGLNITPEEFIQAASQPIEGYSFSEEIAAGGTLEGFLMPGSYEAPREATANELIRMMLDNFEAQVTAEVRSGLAAQGLSLREGVILASIVEREAVVADEMPQIASVFLNRLKAGSKLDADPTVQYALGFNTAQNTWWTNPLSAADLEFDSLYNTYLYAGLPPGAIANPSLEALKAVAFPASTPYFYFRAACDGSGRHSFAETFEQHQANACPAP